jgi:hypothetical protein
MVAAPMSDQDETETRDARLGGSLRRVVLLRETGPKSAAWHRARVRTIWRLHRLLEQPAPLHPPPREEPAPSEQ